MPCTSHPAPTPAVPRHAQPRSLGRLVLEATARHSGSALRSPQPGAPAELSFAELGVAAREIARGLIALGVGPRERVAILAGTRPEWTLADCGALCAGAIVVPVYHTNSPEECQYVLAHSGARVLVCEDAAQLAKIERVRAELPQLEHVVTMVAADGVPSLADLRARAGGVPEDAPERVVSGVESGDLATLVYTSGTTGPPKGCELTHANVLATMEMYEQALRLGPGIVLFMFLPLAHVLARLAQLVAIDVGGTLAFWSGDAARLLDDVAAARPTHLPTVPRLFEKIHARALAGVQDGSPLRRRLFEWAIEVGRQASAARRCDGSAGPGVRLQHAVADRLVLARVRGLFGGPLEMALTGAAPIAREVLEFFDACGVTILEAYGMTETCAGATLNTPAAVRFGTVGRPLAGAEVEIAGDGEVLLRGPNVFPGYHRDAAATAEAFTEDGWLRSGDLGAIDADGFLALTGRKKDLIITSSGKNVSPSNIETLLRESRWIAEAVVIGDNRPYLVALLTLDPEEVPALAERVGVEPDVAGMARDPRVRAVLQEEVDAVNAHFARIEQVKRFAILERDLSQAAGELTPTLKIKRAPIQEHHRAQIEALYE